MSARNRLAAKAQRREARRLKDEARAFLLGFGFLRLVLAATHGRVLVLDLPDEGDAATAHEWVGAA